VIKAEEPLLYQAISDLLGKCSPEAVEMWIELSRLAGAVAHPETFFNRTNE
jgi:hypothetical protein